MKLYVADYLGDTHHLSVIEHGAYLLLLMAMWRAGGTLPSADANLAKLARCTPDQWAEIRDTILPFFRRRGGRISHARLSREMAKYEDTSGKRSEAGKRGASEKASRNSAVISAKASEAASNSRHNQNQNQNQKEKEIEGALVLPFAPADAPESGQAAARARGSRLKADWKPSADNIVYAVSQGFTGAEADRIAEAFRDYWIAATGQKATKLDWSAAWRTWIRNEAQRRPKRGPAQHVAFV
jgi:uncharacterized protein YdaU (DUF1376 family)